MASHLTVTSAVSPGVAAKGLNAASSNAEAPGAFAALLGDVAGANAGSPSQEQPEQAPDVIAAAIAALVPIQTEAAADQAALANALDALAGFRAAMKDGTEPSQDDLDKLAKSLDALAATLGLEPGAVPTLDELAAMAAQTAAGSGKLEAELVSTLAPLATSMLTTTTDSAKTEQLKVLGEKLAALLKSINDGGLDADKLAAVGLSDDTGALDADLQAALAKPETVSAQAASAQVFTAPKLETSEPTLTGKSSTTSDSAAPVAAPNSVAKPDAAPKSASDNTDKRDQPKGAKVDAAPAQAADAQNTGPTGPQPQTRIEAMPVARPVVAGYQTSQQQLNLPQLAFELVRQVNDGHSRFQMRLDPPELGKIDVRLDIDKSGHVTARLTVEKAETLDLMQRDQRGLEKALQQAGLDGAKTNLEFSLKQNSSGGQNGSGHQPFFGGQSTADADDTPAPAVTLYRASRTASGVNIFA